MRQLNKMIFSSALLAAALTAGLAGAALAQGADAAEATEPEDADAAQEVECETDEACAEAEGEVFEDEAGSVFPGSEATADAAPAASSEPELVTPGSTDESNPGGSTRPGTTPDN